LTFYYKVTIGIPLYILIATALKSAMLQCEVVHPPAVGTSTAPHVIVARPDDESQAGLIFWFLRRLLVVWCAHLGEAIVVLAIGGAHAIASSAVRKLT
jgi:hypothetical protein